VSEIYDDMFPESPQALLLERAHQLGYIQERNGCLQKLLKELNTLITEAEQTTDLIANKLVENEYQLRVEHNHGTMKWYAYYGGKTNRDLFDNDEDWKTESDTPTEALRKLAKLQEINWWIKKLKRSLMNIGGEK